MNDAVSPRRVEPSNHYAPGGLDLNRLENDIRELRGAEPGELARRLTERGWTLAAQPSAAVAEHPGEHHEFRTTCLRCGKPGMLHISVITPNERVDITDAHL